MNWKRRDFEHELNNVYKELSDARRYSDYAFALATYRLESLQHLYFDVYGSYYYVS